MEWTVTTFVQAWLENKLGKKKSHASFRILNGDHCSVLVKGHTRYGRPYDLYVIAIRLNSATEDLIFFHSQNTNQFNYQVGRTLKESEYPKLPIDILSTENVDILTSGVIDSNDTHVLIEIGDRPFLLNRMLGSDGEQIKLHTASVFTALTKVPARCGTIEEAKLLTKEPDNLELLCDVWWVEKQPEGFRPPRIDVGVSSFLNTPPNPLNYGFSIEDCYVIDLDKHASILVPHKDLRESNTPNAVSYRVDVEAWNDMMGKVDEWHPLEYNGITTRRSRYGYGTEENRSGTILATPSGVYVTGVFSNKHTWSEQTLTGWWKLCELSNRVKL